MADKKEVEVLVSFENIRVIRFDALNLVIEKLEEVTRVATGKVEQEWKFYGYYGTIKKALDIILVDELLVNEKEVSSLESFNAEMTKAQNKVLDKIKELKV